MKRYAALLLVLIILMFTVPAFAQDDTPVPTDEVTVTDEAAATIEPTSELASATPLPTGTPLPTATPLPTSTATPPPAVVIPPSQDVAIAGVNAFYAFLGGLGVGGLGVAGVFLLATTVILRSPVLLTAIEGVVYSRLDTEGIKNLRNVGSVFDKAGELINKVTDGLPNEPGDQNVTVNVTNPAQPAS